MEIHVYASADELAHAAAENFVQLASECITSRGRFTVALAGGGTPRATYELIGSDAYASRVDWRRVHVFWGDERCVPPSDEASNFRMARAALLDNVAIPPDNVHRIRGEDDPATAAAAYESIIAEIVGDRFDLIHLGMGTDGHIASLFPGSSSLLEKSRKVRAHFVAEADMWRITLTPVAINAAANIIFMVTGSTKAEAVRCVLREPCDGGPLPAQIVEPKNGKVIWLLDREAASTLS
jgi:6-phosphogluconolactonase